MSNFITQAEQLKEQVWSDYYFRKSNRICSRCGDYNKYEIEENRQPIERDLKDYFGVEFFLMSYKIKATRILTKDSLEETAWGCVCQKCKDHILGRGYYDLASSLEDAEFELADIKQNERNRQIKQDDEIKKLRKQFNKDRRENGTAKPVRHVFVQLNPNETEKEAEKL